MRISPRQARRRRQATVYSDEEMEAAAGSMLAEARRRSKRAVPADVVTEGVNKFIPRELMLGAR